jgi:hypothetical protein
MSLANCQTYLLGCLAQGVPTFPATALADLCGPFCAIEKFSSGAPSPRKHPTSPAKHRLKPRGLANARAQSAARAGYRPQNCEKLAIKLCPGSERIEADLTHSWTKKLETFRRVPLTSADHLQYDI